MKYRRIVLIIFIVLVGASIIYGLMDHRRVTTTSEKAYQAFLKGEEYSYRLYLKEALEEFERAIKLDPNFAMAHARAAWLYKSFNNDEAYEKSKTKALSLLDKLKEKERLTISLGFARSEMKTAEVEKYAAELIKKYPASLEALEYLSGRFFNEHKFPEAIEQINKIIANYPDNAHSYNMLAYSYFYIGEYEKALANIDKYSSLAQDQANPHDSHGELLLYMGRYDEALVQFRMADSIKPGLNFVISHIGATYRAKGMYRDAIGAFFKAAELSLNREMRADIESEAALCYVEMNQLDKAAEILQEIVNEMPDHLRSHAILGGVYAEQGRLEDALIQLGITRSLTNQVMSSTTGKMLDEGSIKSGEYYLEGKIAMAKGEYMDAAGKYGWIVDNMSLPERGYFAALMADAFIKVQKPDSAIVVLTKALELNPNSEICLRHLANAYGQQGQKEAQRETLNRYMTLMKDADEGLPRVTEALATLNQLNNNKL
jgi:tetratricopeptide (TPR) repeat protein